MMDPKHVRVRGRLDRAPNLVSVLRLLAMSLAAALGQAAGASAQGLDIGGWSIVQASSARTFTVPAGTVIQPGQYLVLGREATLSAFETFWGVTLGADALYFESTDHVVDPVPTINGDETYTLRNASAAVVDGPTPALSTGQSAQRNDPEAAPWTTVVATSGATPGSGVEAADAVFSGLVISEASDADGTGNYIYEFVELYYDADDGGQTNDPPVISDVTCAPAAPQDGDDLVIGCTAVDPDGTVVSALCWWRYAGGSFASAAMSATGDAWSCTLDDVAGGSVLEYYLAAQDDSGAVTTDPLGAPASFHSVWIQGAPVTSRVVLFDHAHNQDAGDAGNWRIDDNYPDPLPAEPADEAQWSGQLSSWAFAIHQAGHTVRSNTTALSAALLADVDLLVIPEPQNPFTAAEIEAVRQFVYGGGSLMMIADHNSSDRDGDGWDSPSIFGGYSEPHITTPPTGDTETFAGALFGLHFHVKDEGNNAISGAYDNVLADPSNPILHGSSGEVTGVYYHVGNVMTLWPTANPHLSDVGALISKDEGSPHIAAWSRYGSGKVVGYGDSSSMADGTDTETHENNWTEASHREFFLNATWWLLESPAGVGAAPDLGLGLQAWPNPFNPAVQIRFEMPAAGRARAEIYDLKGRLVRQLLDADRGAGPQILRWDGTDEAGRPRPSGVYLVQARGGGRTSLTKVVLAR